MYDLGKINEMFYALSFFNYEIGIRNSHYYKFKGEFVVGSMVGILSVVLL